MPNRIIEVEWEDASGGHYWESANDLRKDKVYIVKTIGYVVQEDDNYILLIQCIDSQNPPHVAGHMRIPRAYVRSVRVIRKGTDIE